MKRDLRGKVYIQTQLDLKVLLFAFVPTSSVRRDKLERFIFWSAPFDALSTFATLVSQESIYAPPSGHQTWPPPSALCLHPPERRGERMTAGRTSTIIKEQKTMLTYCLYLSGGLTKKNTESFPDSWWRIWTPSNGKTANNLGSSLDRRMTEFFFLPPHRILLLLHYL